MKSTLNLFGHLLAQGRRYQRAGRLAEALRALRRLTGFPNLPAAEAEQAQVLMARICLKRGRYRRARRHLAAALAFAPANAPYHYLLARAYRAEGQVDRAIEHYRSSLKLDPTRARCLSELGLLLVRINEATEGLKLLRKATKLAPDAARGAAQLVKGLELAGRHDEARDTARRGLFCNPRSAQFRGLWQQQQFRLAVGGQAKHRKVGGRHSGAKQPTILPFVRIAPELPAAMGATRQDGPATLSPPHFTQPARRQVQ